MSAEITKSNSEVFISYSRKNKQFILELVDALKKEDQEVWIDLDAIPPSAEWWAEIKAGIDRSHTFVPILTPDLLSSPVCTFEMDYALQNNKRIIPVMRSEAVKAQTFGNIAAVDPTGFLAEILGDQDLLEMARSNWRIVERLNWIFIREEDNFDDGVSRLVSALETDLDRARLEARLLTRSHEWINRGRDESVLIGNELREAESWLRLYGQQNGTAAQRAFITYSLEKETENRLREENLQKRALNRARMLAGSFAVFLVIAIGLSLFAFDQQGKAVNNAATSDANVTLAIEAQETSAFNAAVAATEAANATVAQGEAEFQATVAFANLIESQDIQAKFLSDLSQQQYEDRQIQISLNLALEAVNARDDGVINQESFQNLLHKVHFGTFPQLAIPHTTEVRGAKWNPDYSQVVTWAEDDRSAYIWNSETGELVSNLEHEGAVYYAKWNADGSRMLTLASGGLLYVWEIGSASPILTLSQDNILIGAMWNQDETLIVTWSFYGNISIWDSTNGNLLFESPYESRTSGGSSGAIWNQNEDQVLAWTKESQIQVIDVQTLDVVWVSPHRDILGAQYNADETRVISWGEDGTVNVWNANNGALIFTLEHDNDANGAMWNQDETLIFSWSWDDTLRVWNANNGNLIATLPHGNGVMGASISPDRTKLLSWDYRHTWYMWDLEDYSLLFDVSPDGFGSGDNGAIWNQEGTQFLTWGWYSVNIWDANDGIQLRRMYHDRESPTSLAYVTEATWNEDETQILAHSGNHVYRWVMEDRFAQTVVRHVDTLGTSINRLGEYLLTWGGDHYARLWDLTNNEIIFEMPHDDDVVGAQWNEDETQILTWSTDATMRLWDIASRSRIFIMPINGRVRSVSWNNDESSILTVSGNSAQVWDVQSGELVYSLHHDSTVLGAVWNADETQILTWGTDRSTRIWNASNGQEIFRLSHEDNPVLHAEWRPDETQILTINVGGGANVWDAFNGDKILVLQHNYSDDPEIAEYILGGSWRPDGTRIVTWGSDNSLQIWNASSGELIFAYHDIRDSASSIISQDIEYGMWTEDGNSIFTWGDGNRLRRWDVEDGRLIYESFTVHNSAQLSPDEQFVLITSASNAHIVNAITGERLYELPNTSDLSGADGGAIWTHVNGYNQIISWANSWVRIWTVDSDNLITLAESQLFLPLSDGYRQQFFLPTFTPTPPN